MQVIKTAGRWDITIQQGSTFSRVLRFGNLDLQDFEFRGQLRREHEDPDVLASFSFEKLGDNRVSLSLTAAETEGLPAERLVHDIEIYTAGDQYVARILEGTVNVTPEVTR